LKNCIAQIFAVKKNLLAFAFSFVALSVFAQPNTTPPTTVDIIHMKDGRILRGQILIFEEKDGDITFQDIYGRKYSLTREEYSYFEENQIVQERKNKNDTIVKVRKENQFEFSVGLSYASYVPTTTFKSDAYYLQNLNNSSYFPISLQLGAGKYFNRKNFVGLNLNYALISGASPTFNANLRYQFQYDAYKRNTACYIPVEFGYHSLNYYTSFYVSDSIVLGQNSWTQQLNTNVKISSLNLGIGHGFNFMLKNTRSIALELLVYKYFTMSQKFEALPQGNPDFNLNAVGAKLAVFVNI
jgi:hypothetical protein